MVVKSAQVPGSSRWAKSCQCPVVDSRLFRASSDVLPGNRAGRGPVLAPGGCPAAQVRPSLVNGNGRISRVTGLEGRCPLNVG